MKRLFYNPERAEKEKKEKEIQDRKNERKKKYFERLSRDKQFQEFIMEDIIEAELRKQDKTPTFAGIDVTLVTASIAKYAIVKKTGAKEAAQNIKNAILMNF